VTDLDASPITHDLDACAHEIARLRGLMLRQTELLGAAVAVLSSIHKAGGWHVLDPSHQDHMRASLDALEAAVEAMLNKRSSQHGQVE
jgi:hypothetical protein